MRLGRVYKVIDEEVDRLDQLGWRARFRIMIGQGGIATLFTILVRFPEFAGMVKVAGPDGPLTEVEFGGAIDIPINWARLPQPDPVDPPDENKVRLN